MYAASDALDDAFYPKWYFNFLEIIFGSFQLNFDQNAETGRAARPKSPIVSQQPTTTTHDNVTPPQRPAVIAMPPPPDRCDSILLIDATPFFYENNY